MMPDATQEPRRWLGLSARSWHHLAACLTLVALTLGTFSNALDNRFVDYDDWFLVEENPRIQSLGWSNIHTMLTQRSSQGAWLPLREMSYAVDYAIWGLNPFGYHLTNVLFHCANVLLVYAFLVWLLRRWPLAWIAAAWFAVHPVQVESVTWVSGRRDVQYGFFFLLSLLAFFHGRERCPEGRRWLARSWRAFFDGAEEYSHPRSPFLKPLLRLVSNALHRPQVRGWVACYAFSLIALLLALLTKPSAIMLPAILMLGIVLFDKSREPLWQRLAICIPHGVIAGVLAVVHFAMARGADVVKTRAVAQGLANMAWAFASYFRLLFFPVHLATPHSRVPLQWSSELKIILADAAVVVAIVAAAWLLARRRRLAEFCLGWWFLILFPVSNIIPISMLIAERYLYMPIVGACALAAYHAGEVGKRWPKTVGVLACVVLALFAVKTHTRNRMWVDGRNFWRDGVSRWPGSPITRIGLAAAHLDANQPMQAWRQYEKVLYPRGMAHSTNPEHLPMVNAGLLECYDRVGRRLEAEGRLQEALRVYETAVKQMPQRIALRLELVEAYERRGMADKARKQRDDIREIQEGPKPATDEPSSREPDTG